MPRDAIDFSKTIIYKLVCNDKTVKELYVGSTTNFIDRKSNHKCDCISHKDRKVYAVINANGGWGNWDMIQIELYPCSNRQEAYARERQIYDQLEATMNTNKPALTDTERVKYHKDYNCEYRIDNKDKINEFNKQYYIDNKTKIQAYYQVNKEKLGLKFNCKCGGKYTYAHTVQHMKSNKHQQFICQSI